MATTKFEWTNLKLREQPYAQYCYTDKLQFDVTIKRDGSANISCPVMVDPDADGPGYKRVMKVSLEPSYDVKRIMTATGITMATLPKLRETVIEQAKVVWSRWQPVVDAVEVDEGCFTNWQLLRRGKELTVTFTHVPYGHDGHTFSGEATFIVERDDTDLFKAISKNNQVNLINDRIKVDRSRSWGHHDPSGRFAAEFVRWLYPVVIKWLNLHKQELIKLLIEGAESELKWCEQQVAGYITSLEHSRQEVKAARTKVEELQQELQQLEVADNA